MGWVQLILAALSLGKSIFDYLREQEGSKKVAAEQFKQFSAAVKTATKEKKTDELSAMFGAISLAKPDSVPDEKK